MPKEAAVLGYPMPQVKHAQDQRLLRFVGVAPPESKSLLDLTLWRRPRLSRGSSLH